MQLHEVFIAMLYSDIQLYDVFMASHPCDMQLYDVFIPKLYSRRAKPRPKNEWRHFSTKRGTNINPLPRQ